MNPDPILVIGSGGQVGEGLTFHQWNNNVCYLSKNELNIFKKEQWPNLNYHTIVDLIPSPFVPVTFISPDEYFNTYTYPHIEFIANALASGIKNYIFVSSVAVYGILPPGLIQDDDFPVNPSSSYGKSKVMIENALLELALKYKTRVVILRPVSTFNYNFQSSKQRGVIGALLDSFLNDKVFNVYGDINIAKNYVSNKDVGMAIIKAAESNNSGIFNVAFGPAYSIKKLIELFEDTFHKKVPLNFLPAIEAGLEWYCLKSSNAEKLLGFTPKDDLSEWLKSIAKNF